MYVEYTCTHYRWKWTVDTVGKDMSFNSVFDCPLLHSTMSTIYIGPVCE